MVELKHAAHDCVLMSPEIVADEICNICFEEKPVEFACDLCNFDLCKSCSHLPNKVSHDFHPEHPFKLCSIPEIERENSKHMLCSGCGNLFTASLYYKCEVCEIFLDLGCAIVGNIGTSWDAKEMFHYSHAHLLQRCKPGPDATGSCLMCELPLTPSSICFGCNQCYLFVHEHCLDLPQEIRRHPVHPAHPLVRLDFTHSCGAGKTCDACQLSIVSVPLGCSECNFNLHLRCADSLLRGLVHKVHRHKLFYIADRVEDSDFEKVCGVCKDSMGFYKKARYHCVECGWRVHFECVEMPKSVVKKAYHIHPLVCEVFLPEDDDDSLEYCGVCETKVQNGHHAYCCKECDFVSHIECILNEDTRSPLYLKDLYTCGENIGRLIDQERECETNDSDNKIVLNGIDHNHVLISRDIENCYEQCFICCGRIHSELWQCEFCQFTAHNNCVKLRQESRYPFHLKHPLILLSNYLPWTKHNCDICKTEVNGFNLFCRMCNFIICAPCVVKARKSSGELQRGQKFIRYMEKLCLREEHNVVQVMVPSSYKVACAVCNDRLHGNIRSCMECEDIYHSSCTELWKKILEGHPLHSDHMLKFDRKSGSKCNACKLDIVTKYCYFCDICSLGFHFKCIKAAGISTEIKCDKHYLYNFWRNDLSSVQPCMVCKRQCGASFYGCNNCDIKAAHGECIGFPNYVKNQRHQHAVRLVMSNSNKACSLCGIKLSGTVGYYRCYRCKEVFHRECIMSKVEREAATEEDQIIDIYLMYIELDLLDLMEYAENYYSSDTNSDEEDSDSY